jgi:hypothetical protein
VLLGISTLYSCSGQPKPTPSPVVVTIPPLVDKAWDFETTPTWADEFDYAGAPNPSSGTMILVVLVGVTTSFSIIPTAPTMPW